MLVFGSKRYFPKPLITFDSSQRCITFDLNQKWPLTGVKSNQRYGQIWPVTPLAYVEGVVQGSFFVQYRRVKFR